MVNWWEYIPTIVQLFYQCLLIPLFHHERTRIFPFCYRNRSLQNNIRTAHNCNAVIDNVFFVLYVIKYLCGLASATTLDLKCRNGATLFPEYVFARTGVRAYIFPVIILNRNFRRYKIPLPFKMQNADHSPRFFISTIIVLGRTAARRPACVAPAVRVASFVLFFLDIVTRKDFRNGCKQRFVGIDTFDLPFHELFQFRDLV